MNATRSKLTVFQIAQLKPRPKVYEVPDSGGLRLVVQPTGSKSWAMRFRRPDGRQGNLTLGPCDLEAKGEPKIGQPLSLGGARAVAADLNRKRADENVDLIAEKHRVRATDTSNTFGVAAVRSIDEHARRRNRTWATTARLLGIIYKPEPIAPPGGLLATWGSRPLDSITDQEVIKLIDACEKKGAPGMPPRGPRESPAMAGAMYAALSKFFTWCIGKRLIRLSPMVGIEKPYPSRPHDRVLTTDEIARFWIACDRLGVPFGPLCKLLLLTGQRLGEVAGMRRDELSSDLSTWTIPAARVKNKRAHVVPLCAEARDILRSVPQIAGGFVFTTTGRSPVSGFSKMKAQLDGVMDAPSWVLHDLRRTCATGMADIGVAPHIVEAVLNHISGTRSGVAGVYNRAVYANEKREALERWGAHVCAIGGKAQEAAA